MKALLKRLGVIFVVIGVIVLAITEFSKTESNTMLLLSGGLIIGGLVVYIIINSIVE